MARPKNSSPKSSKSKKARPTPTLPLRKPAADKIGGGKRTAIRDAHDKYANQDVHY
jgi:hypothetical protein